MWVCVYYMSTYCKPSVTVWSLVVLLVVVKPSSLGCLNVSWTEKISNHLFWLSANFKVVCSVPIMAVRYKTWNWIRAPQKLLCSDTRSVIVLQHVLLPNFKIEFSLKGNEGSKGRTFWACWLDWKVYRPRILRLLLSCHRINQKNPKTMTSMFLLTAWVWRQQPSSKMNWFGLTDECRSWSQCGL